ncbi:MAG: deoxyribonuclease IV [Candidatus Zipacnadales bacterium]
MRIGFHIPTQGGWERTLRRALERRCETIQIFIGAPVQWKSPQPPRVVAQAWREALMAYDIRPIFIHANYLINLASSDGALWRRSIRRLARDMRHAALLGADSVVVHLGSPGQPLERNLQWCLQRVARAVDAAIESVEAPVVLQLENSAGMGNAVGSCYAHLGEIISLSKYPQRLSVCLDSAHSFAAGYAWHEPEGLQAALEEANHTFGLKRLRLLHINDSRAPFASHVDRHWHIGKGYIGMAGFRIIVNHPLLRDLPMIMETPEASLEADLRNLRALRRCIEPPLRTPLRPRPKW